MEVFATVIQKAVRNFLKKKHENLVIPRNFACPVTMDLFENPVVAADGNTYEYKAILEVINTTMKSPITGQRFQSKNLVPNLNLRSEVMEFRAQKKLKIPTNFHIIQQVAAPAPAPAPAPWVPTTTVYRIMRQWPPMPLGDLFKTDGFLDEIRKPGLSMLLNKLSQALPRPIPAGALSKQEFIERILTCITVTTVGITDAATCLLDDPDFIKHLTNSALDCVLRSFGLQNTGNQVHKAKSVQMNLPITLNIQDDNDQFPLTVTRKMTTEQAFGQTGFKKFVFKHGETVIKKEHVVYGSDGVVDIEEEVQRHLVNMHDYPIKHGDTITMAPRLPPRADVQDGTQIIIMYRGSRPIMVNLNMTVEELKMRMLNYDVFRNLVMEKELDDPVRDFRLRCSGRVLDMENDQTLESYGVEANSTLHLVLRLRGGGKQGVKKTLKAEKISVLKASSLYKASHLSPAAQQNLAPLNTDPQALQTRLAAMTEQQLEAMQSCRT